MKRTKIAFYLLTTVSLFSVLCLLVSAIEVLIVYFGYENILWTTLFVSFIATTVLSGYFLMRFLKTDKYKKLFESEERKISSKALKIIEKTLIVLLVVFLVSTLTCIVVGFIVKEIGNPWEVFMGTAGLSLLMLFLNVYFLNVLSILSDYEEEKENESKRRKHDKRQRKKTKYGLFLKTDGFTDNYETIWNLLSGFSRIDADDGTLLYLEQENIYADGSPSCRCYYFPSKKTGNSLDMDIEDETIGEHAARVMALLEGAGLETGFLDCAIVFFHQATGEEEVSFYQSFPGLVEIEENGSREIGNLFSMHREFTYCGIDGLAGRILLFEPSWRDEGTEADLSRLIAKDLALKRRKLEP